MSRVTRRDNSIKFYIYIIYNSNVSRKKVGKYYIKYIKHDLKIKTEQKNYEKKAINDI